MGLNDIKWNQLAGKSDYFWSLNMRNPRFYGGKSKLQKQDEIYGNVTSTSKRLVIDTGLSYALAPSRDIFSLVSVLENQYGIHCAVNLVETENSLNFNICDLTDKDFSDIPNL